MRSLRLPSTGSRSRQCWRCVRFGCQASLLIALLRASRVPARYVRGIVRLTGAQAMAWTGTPTPRRAADLIARAGIPMTPVLAGGTVGAMEIEHTWVETYVPYSNYRG